MFETRKILGDESIGVSVTCVARPGARWSHSEAVNVPDPGSRCRPSARGELLARPARASSSRTCRRRCARPDATRCSWGACAAMSRAPAGAVDVRRAWTTCARAPGSQRRADRRSCWSAIGPARRPPEGGPGPQAGAPATTEADQSTTDVGLTTCLLIPSSLGSRPSASPTSWGRSWHRQPELAAPATFAAEGCWRSRLFGPPAPMAWW